MRRMQRRLECNDENNGAMRRDENDVARMQKDWNVNLRIMGQGDELRSARGDGRFEGLAKRMESAQRLLDKMRGE